MAIDFFTLTFKAKYLDVSIQPFIFAPFFKRKQKKFGLWCNGSTTGFGSVCLGSNPGSPTQETLRKASAGFLALQGVRYGSTGENQGITFPEKSIFTYVSLGSRSISSRK